MKGCKYAFTKTTATPTVAHRKTPFLASQALCALKEKRRVPQGSYPREPARIELASYINLYTPLLIPSQRISLAL